jgi:hypothetical protein
VTSNTRNMKKQDNMTLSKIQNFNNWIQRYENGWNPRKEFRSLDFQMTVTTKRIHINKSMK